MKNPNARRDDPPMRRRYESHLAQSAFEAIAAHPKKIIVVRFTKRTNGRKRTMRCAYFPEAAAKAIYDYDVVGRSLLPVLDTDDGKAKTIPLDTMEWIKAGGEKVWERKGPSTLAEADAEMEYLFG